MPLTALATLALAAPAVAQEPVPPTYDPGQAYFTCAGTQDKVKNGGRAWGFSDKAPTTSFAAGGGCGFFDQAILVSTAGGGNTLVDAVAEGTFEGAVKSLNVELHELLLSQPESTLLGGVSLTAILEIDGEEVVNTVDSDPPLEAPGTVSSTGATQKITFGIDLSKKPVLDEGEHTYRLTIGKYYSDTASAWVAGATEIPSHIAFNPAKVAKPTIK